MVKHYVLVHNYQSFSCALVISLNKENLVQWERASVGNYCPKCGIPLRSGDMDIQEVQEA